MTRQKGRFLYLEILLVLAGHFLYSSYIKTTDLVIRSDGKGYYDYLPAWFIYHDNTFGFRKQPIAFAEDNSVLTIPCNGGYVNKYTCGLALLWTPFFAITHEYVETSEMVEHSGFSWPYQLTVYAAALAYLLAGLIFLRKLLYLYTQNVWLIRLVQVAFLFGTNLFAFAYFDPAFSHVYSFSLITMFCYACVQWQKMGMLKYLLALAALLALIVLVRPFNILVVLFIPFLTGGWRPFIQFAKQVWQQQRWQLLGAALLFFAIVMIQPIIWFVQCGQFFPWTYSKEGFDFFHPTLYQTLFGFTKGLFVYTPLLLLSLVGFWALYRQKQKGLVLSLLLAFFVLHYFIASWQVWWYSSGLGLRPYIDFYALFAIVLVLALAYMKHIYRWLALVFILFCIVLNLVQTYQVSHFILLADNRMNFDRYKKIFMATSKRYENYLAYETVAGSFNTRAVKTSITISKNDTLMQPGGWKGFLLDSCGFEPDREYYASIEMQLHGLDESQQDDELWVSITDSLNNPSHYEQRRLFHLTEGKNGNQIIQFYFRFRSQPAAQQLHFGFKDLTKPTKIGQVKLNILN